jgi:hypothetical protein
MHYVHHCNVSSHLRVAHDQVVAADTDCEHDPPGVCFAKPGCQLFDGGYDPESDNCGEPLAEFDMPLTGCSPLEAGCSPRAAACCAACAYANPAGASQGPGLQFLWGPHGKCTCSDRKCYTIPGVPGRVLYDFGIKECF